MVARLHGRLLRLARLASTWRSTGSGYVIASHSVTMLAITTASGPPSTSQTIR